MKLKVSVSGGRTSAYMALMIRDNPDVVRAHLPRWDGDVCYTFANTGMEHDTTLDFLHELETREGLPLVWLEAKVNPKRGKGTRYTVVDYDTAHRWHQYREPKHPFHQILRKYGVPNATWGPCTREMKARTMRSWLRAQGLGLRDVYVAIGIREDENRRVTKRAEEQIVYPLIDWFPTTLEDVTDFWAAKDYDLEIPTHLGNCLACYKKSYKKLYKVFRDFPAAFDFTRWAEQEYGLSGAASRTGEARKMFRGFMSTDEVLNMFRSGAYDEAPLYDREDGGCAESCEVYPTENYEV